MFLVNPIMCIACNASYKDSELSVKKCSISEKLGYFWQKFSQTMGDRCSILYIHGMGGGGDSRIPSILSEYLDGVVVRTYSFDPAESVRQIDGWVEELKPSLIIGESLGSLNAIRIKGLPHILISPSLNAPLYLGYLAFLTKIPGMTALLDLIYRPKEGDRQPLHFTYGVMRRYLPLRKEALDNSIAAGSKDYFFSFFGTGDHYRRSGIVSVRTYRKYFGGTYCIYPGTHFMEEEFIISMLIPKIREVLGR